MRQREPGRGFTGEGWVAWGTLEKRVEGIILKVWVFSALCSVPSHDFLILSESHDSSI